jgi:hypothetical protein
MPLLAFHALRFRAEAPNEVLLDTVAFAKIVLDLEERLQQASETDSQARRGNLASFQRFHDAELVHTLMYETVAVFGALGLHEPVWYRLDGLDPPAGQEQGSDE